jgi:type I restriction-modification system DNA methylase subunit
MAIINREMRENAEGFIIRWRGTTAERAEAQTFTNEFFQIFGLDRKNLAQFEKPIQKKDETGTGFADLFWSGKLIIESKSAHLDNQKHWDKTLIQAEEYIQNLLPHQQPQFIMLMNFKRIKKFEVLISKTNKVKINFLAEVPLEQLATRLEEFTFFIEFANRLESDEEKANQEAARRIANVYDAIERKGYDSNEIAVLLARILFCLFAEDTGIFEKKQFEKYIRDRTTGKTLGDHILALFETLNTPVKSRKSTNRDLNKFPYVNGDLFDMKLHKIPATSDALREALLDCCAYDWSDISPVIFGSLFQAVMDDEKRGSLGAHFTSEKNIKRVVGPLFLDKLHDEFEGIKSSKSKLEKFRKKINELTFLDPACGCGNFLVITYRELRLLDIEIIRKIYKGTRVLDSSWLSNVPLENFYGYEIDSTSSMIAKVALWLTEHQMNMRLESEFGRSVPTIPLDEAAIIINDNAHDIKWKHNNVKRAFDFILGNPPFLGKQRQSENQKKDIEKILGKVKGSGVLDYVACWYYKAAEYMEMHPDTKTALVSTNSISQGEQPGVLWNYLFNHYKLKIQFAHQTFKWHNEAEGVAAVHCVVISFSKENSKEKFLFEYEDIEGEPKKVKVKNINPYLVQGNDTTILKRRNPICNVAEISFGSMPNDGGHLLFTDEEKKDFLKQEPEAKKWIKPLLSAHEYLNGKKRWCLWLVGIQPNELKSLSEVYKRVQAVKKHRNDSDRAATKKLAATPYLFGEIRQPHSDYILIPLHSSENRRYIPMGFFTKNFIANNSTSVIPKASKYHFGIMMSEMHMTWVRYVCGRIKSDYRYSNEVVYNNFPWPNNISKKKKEDVEKASQKILEIRELYEANGNTPSDIYGDLMPPELMKAHQTLDKAVDKCYRDSPFISDLKRMEFLFELYETYISGMFPEE